MRKMFIAAAAVAALTSTIGMARAPEAEQRFVHDGETYTYTIRPTEDGSQVIEGRKLRTGGRFRLTVNGDQVRGVSGGVPVSFKLDQARGASAD